MAVDLVCPSYEAKFHAINSTTNNYEDFKNVLNNAFVDVKQNYTAKAAASTTESALDATIDTKTTLTLRERSAIGKFTKKIKIGQATAGDFFDDPRAVEVQFVQTNIGKICHQVEYAMRKIVAELEYRNTELTSRRSKNSAEIFALMTEPDDLSKIVRSAVAMASHTGKTADEMYADGIASVYGQLRTRIADYTMKLNTTLGAFEQSHGAAAAGEQNTVIKDDWTVVQEQKKKLLEYELPKVDPLKPIFYQDMMGIDLIDQVVEIVVEYYGDALLDVHQIASNLFVATALLEFDLKQLKKASVEV